MPDGSETDEPLLPSVAAGDRLAMESCLERYEGLVWALARRPAWDSLDALPYEPAAETSEPSRLDDAGVRALAVLRELPDEQRRLMEWALADGLSHAEIAGRTGTPLGTVKSLIRRGLARVREALEVPA